MEIKYHIFEVLEKRNIARSKMAKDLKLPSSTLQKFRNNESTTLSTIGKICEYLKCPIQDIVEIKLEDTSEREKQEILKKISDLQKKLDNM